MVIRLACVVEGQGDAKSIPAILGRIVASLGHTLAVVGPYRVPRSSLVREGGIERVAERAARAREGRQGILVVLDADDDLPCQLGPSLLDRVRRVRGDVPCCVVVANREKEAWYLAALLSLRGKRGVPMNAEPPPNPESIRDAKGRREELTGQPYSETADQLAFARLFDLDEARQHSPSFDHLWRGVAALVTAQAE